MSTASTQQRRARTGHPAPRSAPGTATSPPADQPHELTFVIPLDRAAELAAAPVAAAGRVLSARGGLPVYVGLGVMAAADVMSWPVAAAAGLGYAVLRRWGPLRPAAPPGRGGAGSPPRG